MVYLSRLSSTKLAWLLSQASTIYREQLGDEFATTKYQVLLKDCDVLHDLVLFVQLKKT